jgi:hypothetical protein
LEADIPDPPAVSFAADIPALNAAWDDTATHWKGSSPLVIHGRPIAIMYWEKVYRYLHGPKRKQWKGIKGKWFDWKVSGRLLSHRCQA